MSNDKGSQRENRIHTVGTRRRLLYLFDDHSGPILATLLHFIIHMYVNFILFFLAGA